MLWPDLELYIDAFGTLSNARPMGFSGPLPIPLGEIESYVRLFGCVDLEEFVVMIQAADRVYLQWVEAERNGR